MKPIEIALESGQRLAVIFASSITVLLAPVGKQIGEEEKNLSHMNITSSRLGDRL